MPAIPILGKLRQEDGVFEFNASLGCMARPYLKRKENTEPPASTHEQGYGSKCRKVTSSLLMSSTLSRYEHHNRMCSDSGERKAGQDKNDHQDRKREPGQEQEELTALKSPLH
jgi:hypothetical protein